VVVAILNSEVPALLKVPLGRKTLDFIRYCWQKSARCLPRWS